MDKTRIADLNRLESDLKTETRPGVRKIIKEAQHKVIDQAKDNWLRDARKELVREGGKNADNMRQIHEDIKKHEGKVGKTSFFFDLSSIEGFNHD